VANRIESQESSFLSKSLSQHILREAFHIEDPERPFTVQNYVHKLEQQTRRMRRKVGRIKRSIMTRLLGAAKSSSRSSASDR
jgi:hypothetical protein